VVSQTHHKRDDPLDDVSLRTIKERVSPAVWASLARELANGQPSTDGANGTPRFVLRSPEVLRNMPSPRWLVPHFLTEDTNSEFFGHRGSLKSFVAQNLAWAGACGGTWRSFHLRPFRTLYVAAEGAQALGKRLRAWELQTGARVPESHFRALVGGAPKLNVERDVEDLLPIVADFQPNWLVFDTLNRTLRGNENDTEVMSLYVDGMDRVRRSAAPGAVATAIHHTSRQGNSRGATVLEDNVDTMVRFSREEHELVVRVEVEKQKDGAEDDPYELTFVIQELGDVDPDTNQKLSSLVLEGQRRARPRTLSDNQQVVLDLLREHAPVSYSGWWEAVKAHQIGESTFKRARAELLRAGRVGQDSTGRYVVATEAPE